MEILQAAELLAGRRFYQQRLARNMGDPRTAISYRLGTGFGRARHRKCELMSFRHPIYPHTLSRRTRRVGFPAVVLAIG